jgi:hypothetical protein
MPSALLHDISPARILTDRHFAAVDLFDLLAAFETFFPGKGSAISNRLETNIPAITAKMIKIITTSSVSIPFSQKQFRRFI